MHGRRRANQHPLYPGIFVQGAHPISTRKRRSFNTGVPTVVAGVHETAETQLLDVVQAMDALGLQLNAAHGSQEQRRENADDRYRHEQFDQRESTHHRGIIVNTVCIVARLKLEFFRRCVKNGFVEPCFHFTLLGVCTGERCATSLLIPPV